MLEGLSNPPVFNQSKLIYLQHTSGIDLYNMYIYARGKKKKKNSVCLLQYICNKQNRSSVRGKTHPICSSSITRTHYRILA